MQPCSPPGPSPTPSRDQSWAICSGPIRYRNHDFSAEQIARAADEQEKYSAALVFSTKYDPQSTLFTMGKKERGEMDERYFGLHHDLTPEAIASQLRGTLIWKEVDQGQWIALSVSNAGSMQDR